MHDIKSIFCSAGSGVSGTLKNGEMADHMEGGKKGLEKAVADRAARWVQEVPL